MMAVGVTGLFLVIVVTGFFSFYVARMFCRVIMYRYQHIVIIRVLPQVQQYCIEEGGGRGLDRTLLNNLPILQFSHASVNKFMHGDDDDDDNLDVNKGGYGENKCAVCLNEFAEGDTVRLLPQCHHFFHKECVDMWLFSHTTCPLCRLSLLNPKNEEDEKVEYGGTSSHDMQHASNEPSCNTEQGADTNIRNESSCAIEIEGRVDRSRL